MKIYKLVNVLGALNDTGKLASDMYELGKKRYYSKAHQQEIPISEMDFQHMVRAFVKQNDEDVRTDTQEGKVRELYEKIDKLENIFECMSFIFFLRLKIVQGLNEEQIKEIFVLNTKKYLN